MCTGTRQLAFISEHPSTSIIVAAISCQSFSGLLFRILCLGIQHHAFSAFESFVKGTMCIYTHIYILGYIYRSLFCTRHQLMAVFVNECFSLLWAVFHQSCWIQCFSTQFFKKRWLLRSQQTQFSRRGSALLWSFFHNFFRRMVIGAVVLKSDICDTDWLSAYFVIQSNVNDSLICRLGSPWRIVLLCSQLMLHAWKVNVLSHQ